MSIHDNIGKRIVMLDPECCGAFYSAGASGIILQVDRHGDYVVEFDQGTYDGAPNRTTWYVGSDPEITKVL